MGYLDTLKSAVGIKPAAAPAVDSTQNPNSNMRFQKQEPASNIGLDGNPAISPTPDPQDPNNPNANGGKSTTDPFAKFSKMWDNPTNPDVAPAFTLDPTQFKTIVEAQDFTQGVDPELMQKATAGDIPSMIEMMKVVSRNSYRTAMEHNSKLTEGFVNARETHGAKSFGGKVKGELTQAGLSSIAASKNPVVRQQLKTTAESLQKTHPDASPEEIVQMTLEYFQELSSAINGGNKQESGGTAPKDTNWDEWFGN